METLALIWYGFICIMLTVISAFHLRTFFVWKKTLNRSRAAFKSETAREAFDPVMLQMKRPVTSGLLVSSLLITVLSWSSLIVLIVGA